jgi:hypothetical protein
VGVNLPSRYLDGKDVKEREIGRLYQGEKLTVQRQVRSEGSIKQDKGKMEDGL